jgi:hypothetical protein
MNDQIKWDGSAPLMMTHPAFIENTGLKDRIQDLYGQLNTTEKEVDDLRLLLAQALKALEHHTEPTHPAQIPYRDRIIDTLRARLYVSPQSQ